MNITSDYAWGQYRHYIELTHHASLYCRENVFKYRRWLTWCWLRLYLMVKENEQ